ncbi:MAG: ATP-binding protein [Candidatus Hydrogenedentota bacterium]
MLAVSLALQILAAILALRMIRYAGSRMGWILLAVALLLMAVRRSVTFSHLLLRPGAYQADAAAEIVALIISVCAITAMILLVPTLRQMRLANDRLISLVNPANFIIWEVDLATLQFTFVSPQAERLLGYPANQWIAEKDFWVNHMHPDDREWAFNYCVAETRKKQHHDFIYRMIALDGRVVWIQDIVSVVLDERGRAPAFLRGVMVDITERKLAEDKTRDLAGQLMSANEYLKKANEKLKELDVQKSEFLAMISHELRTPLAAMNGALENLMTGTAGPLAEKQVRMMEIMSRNNSRLSRLIENLLDMSQIEGGRFALNLAELDLRKPVGLAVDTLRDMAARAGRVLSYEQPREPLVMRADQDRVTQIVTNLLDNSIRHAKRNIRILLSEDGGSHYVLMVENDGEFIAEAHMPRLFDRFSRSAGPSSDGNVGLGLSIVQALTQAHAGQVNAENLPLPAQGVRFTVRLPRDPRLS